jgi:dipeptidyl aminopeptidase/acylaminoacyl peptidase
MRPRTCCLLVAIVICGLATTGLSAAPTDQRTAFDLDAIDRLAELTSPAISPDGRHVAVVYGRVNTAENRVDKTLLVVDIKTRTTQRITTADVRSPSWSPSGDMLAWLAPDIKGVTQISIMKPQNATSTPIVITRQGSGADVGTFAWNPDGKTIAFLAGPPAAPTGIVHFDRSFEVSRENYLSTSSLATSPPAGPSRLWLIRPDGSLLRQIDTGPGYPLHIAWQPDGASIVAVIQPGATATASLKGSIVLIDTRDGKQTTLITETANVGSYGDLHVSQHGAIAYQHFRGGDPWTYPNNAAIVVDGVPRDLTRSIDRDIDDLTWLPDGTSLLVKAMDRDHVGVWYVSATGTTRAVDTAGLNPVSDLSVARTGAVAFVATAPDQAAELYVKASLRAKPVRLTAFNGFIANKHLGRSETVQWRNSGFDHTGIVTYPAGWKAGDKARMLVRVHGGPQWTAINSLNAESQFFAAQGWIVFEPNYRGSSGQGERYQTAVVGDVVAGAASDVTTGIASLGTRYGVKASSIAVDGYSFGGVVTSWLIASQNFCAAVPSSLVVDFADYYSQSEGALWLQTVLGSPYRPGGIERYRQQSPISYADRIKTPTLIMHNIGDPNAPVSQSYKLYHALQDNSTIVRLVVRDLSGHMLADPYAKRDSIMQEQRWLTQNCTE